MVFKDVLIKYYTLDEETRNILPLIYIYDELTKQAEEFENVKFESLCQEEIFMNLVLFCTTKTTLDISEIIHRMLEVIDGPDMSIYDLAHLSNEELLAILDLDAYEYFETDEDEEYDEDDDETEDKDIVVNVYLDKKEKD